MTRSEITVDPNELDAFFTEKGYILVRNVLKLEEVSVIRSILESAFLECKQRSNAQKRYLLPSEVLKIRELYLIPFRNPIVSALKNVLGAPYTMFADFQVHRNLFGSGRRKSWHTDSGSEGSAEYLLSRDYRFVKCGVYLQDNDRDWGGGIEVLPGGHRFPLMTRVPSIDFKIKYFWNRIGEVALGQSLEIKAGDFVFFDSRLPHTSTWPSQVKDGQILNDQLSNVPPRRTKFVLYWNACRLQNAHDFLVNSEARAEKEDLETPAELFFSDYLQRSFPKDYPDDFVDGATRQGITVASLDELSARRWSDKYQSSRIR